MLDKMNKEIFRTSCLILIVMLLSGCTDGGGVQGTGLVVRNYNLDPLAKVYSRIPITMYFWLENEGGADARKVDLKFFDLQGFTVEKIDCEDGHSINDGCHIDIIEYPKGLSGQGKKVQVLLRAPETGGERTVSFSVRYDYSGYTKLMFNIWKRGSEGQYGEKRPLQNTGGPLKVEIESDFILKRIVNDQEETVTEWVEEGQRFPIKINLAGDDSIEVDRNNFRIRFNHLRPISGGNCDFEARGDYYVIDQEIEVPSKEPLACEMIADTISQEWVTGSIEIDYGYGHRFVRQQDFEIEST